MKKLKHYLTASTGVILFVSVIVFSLPQTGHSGGGIPPEKDVRVVNSPAEPVPVVALGTTSVAVQNTPTVNAKQSGLWTVGISGTPTVQLDASAANPVFVRDVDRPTAQPFQREVVVTLNPGDGGANEFISVPIGKTFVIEQVSASGAASTDQLLEFSLLTRIQPDNTLRPHYLTAERTEFGGVNQYRLSQQVRIYSSQGSFGVRVSRIGGNDTVTVRYTVSGYFVNN